MPMLTKGNGANGQNKYSSLSLRLYLFFDRPTGPISTSSVKLFGVDRSQSKHA